MSAELKTHIVGLFVWLSMATALTFAVSFEQAQKNWGMSKLDYALIYGAFSTITGFMVLFNAAVIYRLRHK